MKNQRLLILTWFLLVMPPALQAQLRYLITTNLTVTITGYTGPAGAVIIPSMTNGLPVTAIGANAFYPNPNVTDVTIPESVTSIGASAFEGTGLTSVTIPASVTRIGDLAFSKCYRLLSISVNATNQIYSSVDGVLHDKAQTTVFQYPGGKAGNYTVLSSVSSIYAYAFAYCHNLTGVTIPTAAVIGVVAFGSCTSLTNVSMGSSATIIGAGAFSSCSSLIDVTLGSNVVDIQDNAFSSCAGLASITIPNKVTNIGVGVFSFCSSLASVTIPNSVANIAAYAFSYCTSLTNVIGGNGVTNIGTQAFIMCSNLVGVTIGNSVTSIGDDAFNSCYSLNGLAIPNSVRYIGHTAFQGCESLTNLTIGDGVTTLVDGAFEYCTSLTNVTIGNGLTNIPPYAFWNCTSLTTVTLGTKISYISSGAFATCPNLAGVYFHGNAPSADSSTYNGAFSGADHSILYYLSWTSGWSTSLAGRPTLPIRPQVQIGFAEQTKQFGFNITGTYGLTVVVEAATNLAKPVWTRMATNTLAGAPSYFSDPKWTNYPRRFYRVQSR
jgi:hypothetical protein